MAGVFLPVCPEKYPALLKTLEYRLPNSARVFNILKLKQCNRFSEKMRTIILAFNENVEESALIVAVQDWKFKTPEELSVSVSGPTNINLNECLTSEIIDAFEKTINWKEPICFGAVDDDLMKHLKLQEMCARNGILHIVDPNYMYHFPIRDALKLNVGENGSTDENGITISTLSKEDGKTVTDYWQFSGPGTLERMEDIIETIGSAGVYLDSPDRKVLASWVIAAHSGSIHALFTHPDHRRRGFGQLTMNAVSKWTAQDGRVPNVQVQLPNTASKLLMERIGYLYSHRVSWVIFRPKE